MERGEDKRWAVLTSWMVAGVEDRKQEDDWGWDGEGMESGWVALYRGGMGGKPCLG